MMKFLALLALLGCGAATSSSVATEDRTITKVVKLLQNMLDKSKEEGDEERKIYAKFKCYCDQNEAEKNANIKRLTEEIALLESKIDETQGSTGGLSSEVAELDANIAANEQAQADAKALRNKQNAAYKANRQDLEQAIEQMDAAIGTLSEVGADQTLSKGADSDQFLAGHSASLLSVRTQLQSALRIASGLMGPGDQKTTAAFLQAPFTGTYTSQSGVVMGILKSMRDTFKANLADAIKTENDAQEAHDKLIELKKEELAEMKKSFSSKQKSLSGNDGSLSDLRKSLKEAKNQKQSDEKFLESLLPTCKDKADQYEKRNTLRVNEEAAIAKAISILNSDDAFATFGGNDATSTGATGFLQLRSIRQHDQNGDTRRVVQRVLQEAGMVSHSARLSKVVTALRAENPFDTVLGEIDNMLKLIDEEQEEDQEKLDWCKEERSTKDEELEGKKK